VAFKLAQKGGSTELYEELAEAVMVPALRRLQAYGYVCGGSDEIALASELGFAEQHPDGSEHGTLTQKGLEILEKHAGGMIGL
jgi:hypothetical protein